MTKDYCSFVPDQIKGYDLSKACENHDTYYYLIETDYAGKVISLRQYKKFRKMADLNFLRELKKALPFYLWFIAYFYYFGVRMFGTPSRVKFLKRVFELEE